MFPYFFQEEEKTWISDEDLYTEGSSDEENCRCNKEKSSVKSSNQSSLASSTTTITTATTALDNPHQQRPKPKRSKSSRSSDSLLAVQSTSRCSRESSRSSMASDEETELMEEEEDIADEEISWKVNRGTSSLKSLSGAESKASWFLSKSIVVVMSYFMI